MKVLRVLYESGHEEHLLVNDSLVTHAWNLLDFSRTMPLFIRHRGGTARINLSKVLSLGFLDKKIVLKIVENPLNIDSHYDDPCN